MVTDTTCYYYCKIIAGILFDNICFLQVGHIAAKIHCEFLCLVYSDSFMSNGTVRDCCRKLKERHTNVCDKRKMETLNYEMKTMMPR